MLKTKRRTNPVRNTDKAAGVKKTLSRQQRVNKQQIKTKEVYDLTMAEIDRLMKKGEKNLSATELSRLSNLAEAAELYEYQNEPLPMPSNLPDIIRIKMYSLHMTQSYAAKLLGVSDTKFSMIMNGKQKPDIFFIKSIHDKLQIDGNMILKAI
jgi:HTH-type transcriptional regulator / antitoxin HigA